MFRSQIDHHQGNTIFVLTSVTKFNFIDVAACLHAATSIKLNLVTEVKTNIVFP